MIRNKKRFGLFTAAFMAAVFIIGAAYQTDVLFKIKKNFTIFSEVYREVSLRYVDEVDPEKLMRKGINAMLESLDPYTVLIDENMNQQLNMMTTGNYAGVGLEVGSRGGKIVVIAPIEGHVAHRRGIKAGDVLVSADGVKLEDMSPEEVQKMMRGEPGSTIDLVIQRYGVDKQMSFTLERERIEVKNITYTGFVGPTNDIGYILLSRFSQNTAEEIRNAILELQKNNELKGLILDLRNNPGGLLDEAVKTADKFIQPGITVVKTKGRSPEQNNEFKSEEVPLMSDKPLVILQNGGSASASEVLAGALQDLDRAVIVGEKSFGKGLVQVVKSLSYNTSLKITTSRYYTPSGRSIQSVTYTHDEENNAVDTPDSLKQAFKTRAGRTVYDGQGIRPDIKVEKENESLLELALMENNHYFFFANQYTAEHDSLLAGAGNDQLYNNFLGYLEEKEFDFETKTERSVAQLVDQIEQAGLKDESSQQITALRSIVEQHKEQAFQKQRQDIQQQLYLELVSRYNGRSGKIEASTAFDPYIQKAVDIVESTQRYSTILSPSK